MIIAMYFYANILALMVKGLPDWLYWLCVILQAICLIYANSVWTSMKDKVNSLEKALERKERDENKNIL